MDYQASNNEAVIQAKLPYWPNPDVHAGEERNQAEGKERYSGADVDLREESDALIDLEQRRRRCCFHPGRMVAGAVHVGTCALGAERTGQVSWSGKHDMMNQAKKTEEKG